MRDEPAVIVLLPGLDGTGRLFGPLVAALAGRARVEVVPYPVDEPLGYAALTARVEARLPRSPCLLVAESFSGPIALRLAAAPRAGLLGVVLAGSFATSPVAVWAPLRGLVALAMRARPPRAAIRALLAGRDADDALVTDVAAAVRGVEPRVLAARLGEVLAVDVEAELRALRVPLLVLTGARDRLVGARTWARLLALRPDAEHVVLDAPHLMLQRRPAEAAQAILAFVARLQAR